MDSKEEPFTIFPEGEKRIIIHCKEGVLRDEIYRLKHSVIMRHMKKSDENETDCYIDCKNEKRRDKLLLTIHMTMYAMRKVME